jgi:hypothetical protein
MPQSPQPSQDLGNQFLALQENINGKFDRLLAEICELKQVNLAQKNYIKKLEDRIDDLEQYTRADDLIITGLKTTAPSYAAAAEDGATE